MIRIIARAFLVVFLVAPTASALESKASHLIVMDDATGAVMMQRQADETMYPASMTKMMTAHLLFKALKEGRYTLEDTFPVSETAWRMQGSKMFVELGNAIAIGDLIRGIVIQSGNDACIVVAEGMAGTEATFAELMNDEAKRLGMTGSHFVNATGWPDERHITTARDLATLAQATIHDSPDYYAYYGEKEYTYHGIRQYNRNLLLGRNLGVDGLKTGHTEASGYGITVSAKNNEGRRVIVVVNGLSSEKERAGEAAALVGYAFGAFENVDLAKGTPKLGTAPVWMGAEDTVALRLGKEALVTLPRAGRGETGFTLLLDAPVAAPLEAGQQLGTLLVSVPEMAVQTLPVYAAESVEKAGFFRRVLLNLQSL